ncbi:sodium-dependent organic anion transporter isoform X2 [Meriones unguiculatus]|uniref:sodium-dependent organic anion transporter isoform X2 n=1 Tax=Meriones unguiculatus TaxID=10047 RepID=UPI00293E272F|nr:sodium-dependent organic anion transporter isoform X2 [Meriones unguiculatus]
MEEERPGGLEGHGNLKLVFTVASAVMVGLVMFSFGCSAEIRKLWLHLRRPWGIAVGLLCQFGLMPLTAYLLAVGFSLKPIQVIAVLILGCCPGGTVSNILTFWVDGDMDLSISMTTCSTVAALGMMPLCLYLYTRTWTLAQNLTIPYQSIGITLVSLIVPVAFGVYVNHRWPKRAKVILKVGAAAGGVLLLVVAVTSVVLARAWNLPDVTLLIISFIFPLVGHVMGFLLAFLTHQSWQSPLPHTDWLAAQDAPPEEATLMPVPSTFLVGTPAHTCACAFPCWHSPMLVTAFPQLLASPMLLGATSVNWLRFYSIFWP